MNRPFQVTILILFALLPLIAALAPRALCVAPSLLGLVMATTAYFTDRRIAWPFRPFLLLLSGTLLFAAASTLWAVAPDMALEKPLETLAIFLPGLFGYAALRTLIAREEGLGDKILAVLFPLTLVACALMVIEIYGGMPIKKFLRPILDTHKPRLSNLNRGVIALLLIQLPLAALLWQKHRRRALVLLGAAAVMAAGTQSQSAQMAVLLGLAFFFLFPVNKPRAFRMFAALLVILTLAAPFIAPPLFKKTVALADSYHFLSEKAYAPPRLEIWDFVARRALEKPLYGHGVEATRAITDFDTAQLYHKSGTVLHPHNFALQLWIELGVTGALLGGALLVLILELTARLPETGARRLALGLLAFCLAIASFGYGLWQNWWIGALVLALLMTGLYPDPRDTDRRAA